MFIITSTSNTVAYNIYVNDIAYHHEEHCMSVSHKVKYKKLFDKLDFKSADRLVLLSTE